jgi:hypothetical protein
MTFSITHKREEAFMAHQMTTLNRVPRRQHDAIEFKLLFWTMSPLFFAAALVARVLPRQEPVPGLRQDRRSVFHEAKVIGHAMITFAFMG